MLVVKPLFSRNFSSPSMYMSSVLVRVLVLVPRCSILWNLAPGVPRGPQVRHCGFLWNLAPRGPCKAFTAPLCSPQSSSSWRLVSALWACCERLVSVLKARRLHVVVRNYLFAVCESLGALFHIPELAQWIPLAQGSWAKGLGLHGQKPWVSTCAFSDACCYCHLFCFQRARSGIRLVTCRECLVSASWALCERLVGVLWAPRVRIESAMFATHRAFLQAFLASLRELVCHPSRVQRARSELRIDEELYMPWADLHLLFVQTGGPGWP